MSDDSVIGAFSEEHASRISGVSLSQLRHWDRLGFFEPSFAVEDRRAAYSRVYSFNDLVALRVLNALRNEHGVSLQHLRAVSNKLARMRGNHWSKLKLWVLNKRVVFADPTNDRRREVLSGQYVLDVPIRVAVSNTQKAIADLNQRGDDRVGRITRERFISHYEPIVAGTRISVVAIKRFWDAGYSVDQIINEYPDLTPADVQAAIAYRGGSMAA